MTPSLSGALARPLRRLRALAVLAALASCGGGPPADREPAAIPKRVVSLSPDLTEVLVAIGAKDVLVGVTDFCLVSVPEVGGVPSVGGFLNPNVEVMVSLRPELVVGLTWHEELLGKLRDASLRTLQLSNEPLEDALRSMRTLADAVGRGDRGAALVGGVRRELDELRLSREGKPRPRVLVVAGRNPGTLEEIYVAGGRSFLGELTAIAGGDNVFAESPVLYPRVSKEEIVARDPEVVLELSDVTGQVQPTDGSLLLAVWSQLPTLSAVKSGRLRFLDQGFIGHPGPHIPEIARVLAEAIHAPAGSGPR